jgi:uncharacterized membrane protein YdjX (TVP38/TMEM64 family)
MCQMSDEENAMAVQNAGPGFSLKRLVPLLVLAAGVVLFYGFGLDDYVTFDALREHRETMLALVAEHRLLAPLIFMVIYVAAIAFSLPGGAIMTIAGGFLFGTVAAASMVVVSATLGATILFMVAKTAVGDALRAKAGPWIGKMAQGFQDNALSYLLFLRLIPAFPFFVVNLVPAFLGVPLSTYVIGTFFGIIPGTLAFAFFGASVGELLDSSEAFSVSLILTPQLWAAFIALAVIALLPIAYKKWKSRRG